MTPVIAIPAGRLDPIHTAALQVAARPDPTVASNTSALRVTDHAPSALTLCDPALESYFAARLLYDPRIIGTDTTPRGVDIDRIEMIKTGFDHIRDMIGAISDSLDAEKPSRDSAM